jgi:RNA-directed DNA polymerase
MLKSNSRTRYKRKVDWFPSKVYLHFDTPLARPDAEALVTDPIAVSRHSFLPLISFVRRERRFRRQKGGAPLAKWKSRTLAYCSNVDACIYSYYAEIINDKYESLIKKLGIDDTVIGYRRIGSNIDLAFSAFSEIQKRGSCVAFAYDISGFFDGIDHGVLKRNWCRVLGVDRLPDDHYKIFRNLTSFSSIDRRACLRRLGHKPSLKDSEIPDRPLCSVQEFRKRIRGDDGSATNLVVPWKRDYRIPQGTPMSALAANISMIDFDIQMRAEIVALGGSYRRYSDDILIIVPSPHRAKVQGIVDSNLKLRTRRLKLNKDKTEEISFIPGALARGHGTKALQYLGFTFDGRRRLMRSSTLAKYYRRMHRAVQAARSQKWKAIFGEVHGRSVIYKRQLLSRQTHLGPESFNTTYGASARAKMGAGIGRQLGRHQKILNALIER